MKLTTEIKELVTQIVARDVAAGVELARSIGHQMPKDFAVGVRFVEDGERTRVRMRLDDATHDAIVTLPHLDGRLSLVTVDAMWKAAWDRIHADALILAQVWLDKHPETFVSKEGATKALAILDALEADDALHARWMESCLERAKHFTYRSAGRAMVG
jgi:hypothetical protein